MNINIREIFESDLDPNSTAWWSSDKIDKINYNFGQVSTGGVRGPQGYIGIDGDSGAIGSIGGSGTTGPQGLTGPQGPAGINFWDYAPPTLPPATISGSGYLFPKRDTSTIIQYAPPVLEIGIDDASVAYNAAASYNDYVVLSNVNLASPTASTIETNLRLQSNDNASTNYVDMQLTSSNILKIGRLSNIDPGLKINHVAKSMQHFTDILTHEINGSAAHINKPATFNKRATINQVASYASHPGDPTNKILTSADGVGKIQLRELREVFPSFPIGSIISIRGDEFNDTNFHINETITQDLTATPLPILDNRFGRGRADSPFAGWYLCNGLYWEDPVAVLSPIQTPNLNGFTYYIEGNGGDQPTVSYGLFDNILIGGIITKIIASQTAPGKYDVNGDYVPVDNLASGQTVTVNAGTQYEVSNQIHIVYLGSNNLVWRDDTP